MAIISHKPITWSGPITVEDDEFWQARAGSFALTRESDPADNDGIIVPAGEGITVAGDSGRPVRVRNLSGIVTAVIAREAL